MINLKEKGVVTEHIKQFQKLNLRVKNILEDNLLNIFMGTLKENIQHEIHILEPKSLENIFSLERKIESKNMMMTTRRTTSYTYRENNVTPSNPPQQLDERR